MERNVPKLRFKGFNDEWNELKVSDTLKIRHGKDQKKIECENGEYPILATGGEIGRTDTPIYDKESVLIGRKGTIDRPIYMNTPFWTVDTLFYSEIHNNYIPKFIYYKFQCINWKKYCEASGVPSLSASTIESIKYKLPSLQEQERIANFLTKVDKIIEKQEEKVKNLENYKKGMMQKIFSQEIRFKDEDGEEYPEWEDKKIVDIFIEINEKTSIKNQYEVLSSTSTGLFKQSEYFNREIASEDNTGYKILRKKQIVLSPQNLWLGNINYNNKYETGIVSPSYKIFNVAENTLPQFVAYIIKLDRMLYEYKQASEQGASVVRRNLNMDLFNDIVIKLPCYREQSRITAYLNNIDVILEKEKNKLEELKQWKKGLLQQMFV